MTNVHPIFAEIFTRHGFGDEATWGAPTGHRNDPRTDRCSYRSDCVCEACFDDVEGCENDEEF